jgi:hypothetical protein
MTDEKYYTVTFRNYPNATQYAYGENVHEAIENAAAGMFEDGHATPYLAPRVRPTVYKEWIYSAEQYSNDGSFTR